MELEKSKVPLTLSHLFLLFSILLAFASVFIALGVLLGTCITSIREVPSGPVPIAATRVPTTTPSLDPTVNWKAYTNNQYGFLLKYPPEMEDAQESGESFTAYFQGKADYPYSMIIDVVTEEESFTSYVDNLNKLRGRTYKSTNLMVGNNKAVQYEITDNPKFPQMETFIDGTPKMIVQLLLMDSKNISSESLRELNKQILSTFKFTQ